MNRRDMMNRLEMLNLLIEPDADDKAEIALLQKKCKQHSSSVAFDDENDPDPESRAARLHMVWTEQYKSERRRDERVAGIAQRAYAKQFQEMNKCRL